MESMTPADQARAMGDYIREHGFSPLLYGEGQCGCFLTAYNNVCDSDPSHFPYGTFADTIWRTALMTIIGAESFSENDLIAAGYASDADRDKAVEACYAAARMLEGK